MPRPVRWAADMTRRAQVDGLGPHASVTHLPLGSESARGPPARARQASVLALDVGPLTRCPASNGDPTACTTGLAVAVKNARAPAPAAPRRCTPSNVTLDERTRRATDNTAVSARVRSRSAPPTTKPRPNEHRRRTRRRGSGRRSSRSNRGYGPVVADQSRARCTSRSKTASVMA